MNALNTDQNTQTRQLYHHKRFESQTGLLDFSDISAKVQEIPAQDVCRAIVTDLVSEVLNDARRPSQVLLQLPTEVTFGLNLREYRGRTNYASVSTAAYDTAKS